ncbi:MAG: hypothetical protein NTZ61_15625, partial [Proteobacteria bacterium]|nr:hypothetical protein [Pseudomonadota bacterium]
ERRETDRRVVEGRFDLLIAIYEKMKSYLVVHPELLSQVGLVVMDEVQMLGEPGRGEVVEVGSVGGRGAGVGVRLGGNSVDLAWASGRQGAEEMW